VDSLLVESPGGLFCPAGDFYVDAWRGVERNIVSHAHSDHARRGSAHYLAAADGVAILKERIGSDSNVTGVPYGEAVNLNGVHVSLHPAGHVRGSAQVRIENRGRVLVFSGDYKRQPDPTCDSFEPVRCHEFITESTFGLPIYRWPDPTAVAADINAWWRRNVELRRTSVILAYTLGKAQRVLSMLDRDIGPILLHGSMLRMTQVYRETGCDLPPAEHASPERAKAEKGRALVIAPPSAHGSTWMRKFLPISVGSASGWMAVRGHRRRRSVDRGFVLSDHADWPDLLRTITDTAAERVGVTHGYTGVITRFLRDRGADAYAINTRFVGDADDPPESETLASAGAVEADGGTQE